jgi:hypothetical protein
MTSARNLAKKDLSHVNFAMVDLAGADTGTAAARPTSAAVLAS